MCVAVCCRVLLCVAQCNSVHRVTLQCDAACCSVLPIGLIVFVRWNCFVWVTHTYTHSHSHSHTLTHTYIHTHGLADATDAQLFSKIKSTVTCYNKLRRWLLKISTNGDEHLGGSVLCSVLQRVAAWCRALQFTSSTVLATSLRHTLT